METILNAIFSVILLAVLVILLFSSKSKTKWTTKGIAFGIGFLDILIFLIYNGWTTLGEFFEKEEVQRDLFLMSITLCIVFFARFKKETFGPFPIKGKRAKRKAGDDTKKEGHKHGHHEWQEVLLGSMHGNYVILVLTLDKYLKKVKANSEQASKLHDYYLIGVGMISLLIVFFVVPLVDLMSHAVQYNVLLVILYVVADSLILATVGYWALAGIIGRRKAEQGHYMIVYLNDKIVAIKKHGGGLVLTFPGLDLVKVEQIQAKFIINCNLDNSEPWILTANEKTAVYPDNSTASVEQTRFTESGFMNRMYVNHAHMTTFVELLEGKVIDFLEKEESMGMVKAKMLSNMKSVRLNVLGKKNYAQDTGSTDTVEEFAKTCMNTKLASDGGYFRSNVFNIEGLDFAKKPLEKPEALAA